MILVTGGAHAGFIGSKLPYREERALVDTGSIHTEYLEYSTPAFARRIGSHGTFPIIEPQWYHLAKPHRIYVEHEGITSSPGLIYKKLTSDDVKSVLKPTTSTKSRKFRNPIAIITYCMNTEHISNTSPTADATTHLLIMTSTHPVQDQAGLEVAPPPYDDTYSNLELQPLDFSLPER
jgi:hypothetical protein